MKILIILVSCFLSISILNAEDIKKSTAALEVEVEKPELLKPVTDNDKGVVKSTGALAGKPITISSNTLKGELQIEKKKKPKIITLAELRKLQNMEIVKLKKSQTKEFKFLMENEGTSVKSNLRMKMKTEHRTKIKDLKLRHRKEQVGFRKAHSLKKDSKKGKEAEKRPEEK